MIQFDNDIDVIMAGVIPVITLYSITYTTTCIGYIMLLTSMLGMYVGDEMCW